MHQLMQQYTQASESQRPRVIGLTGMLLSGCVKRHGVVNHLEKLEAVLHGTIAAVASIEDHENVLTFSTNPDEKIVKYETHATAQFEEDITSIVRKIIEKVNEWPALSTVTTKIKKMLDDFLYQMSELGENLWLLYALQ